MELVYTLGTVKGSCEDRDRYSEAAILRFTRCNSKGHKKYQESGEKDQANFNCN